MKQLTEREAWLYLARKWERPTKGEDGLPCAFGGDERDDGVCFAISALRTRALISGDLARTMRFRLDCMRPFPMGRYYWELTAEGAQERATACGLLAAMCEEEE